MLRELADGRGFAGDRDEVKLMVLDSACQVFCGGIDVGEYTSQRVFQMLDAFHAAFAGMLETAKPVICVVNGPAIGGGAELAAFGDFVIATPKARFAQPEISIGVFPPLASTILPFLVGPRVALELVLTGEPVSAERALELGLVNKLVPEVQLQQAVSDLIHKITSHSGAVLTMAKRAILGGMGMSLKDGLKHSMNIFLNELYRLEDSQEGVRALVEKRKPTGRTAERLAVSTRPSASETRKVDTLPTSTYTHFSICRHGSGEGRENRPRSRHCKRLKAVSQTTLPCRRGCALFARKSAACGPVVSRGIFFVLRVHKTRSSEILKLKHIERGESDAVRKVLKRVATVSLRSFAVLMVALLAASSAPAFAQVPLPLRIFVR